MLEAELSFLVDTGEKPVVYPSRAGGEPERRTGRYQDRSVEIHDGRQIRRSLSLDHEGFLLVDHQTAVDDLYDDDAIRGQYDEEIAGLVAGLVNAAEVRVFDHTRRAHEATTRSTRRVREPVRTAHSDYTDSSAHRRLRDLLGDGEAGKWLGGRFAIINVWRPIRGPVETAPLALCDARSVDTKDLVPVERRAPERIGELYHLVYSPRHRWFYFPAMSPNEALVFKTYDSDRAIPGRFAPHTAFDGPRQISQPAGRESIETRALVRF